MNDYIQSMRKLIGHETLMTVGCGVIVINDIDQILLQRRKDQNNWCIPGGVMNIGETFSETAVREVLEETNLLVRNLALFGIYSGSNGIRTYPNGDRVFSVQIIFISNEYDGDLRTLEEECFEHRFFSRDELPLPLNPAQECFILDWAHGTKGVIVK